MKLVHLVWLDCLPLEQALQRIYSPASTLGQARTELARTRRIKMYMWSRPCAHARC